MNNICKKCGKEHTPKYPTKLSSHYCGPCCVLLGFRSKLLEDMTQPEFGDFESDYKEKQKLEPIPFNVLKVETWPEIEDNVVGRYSPRYNSTVLYFKGIDCLIKNRRFYRVQYN